MSAPKKDDAAFKYTEGSQVYWHFLGAKLRKPVADTAQVVHSFNSADLTTIRRIAIGSGVQDLSAQIRYDGMTESLRRFLASARRGASLEYFPSVANPSESYPCVLMEDDGVALDQDFWWQRRNAVGVKLRRIDGGSWVGAVSGSLFYYRAGNPLPGLTFTRSGAVGTYVDEDGVVQDVAANIVRTTWIDRPRLLLEASRANLVLQSEDLTTTWADIGTPTVGAAHTASGVSLDLLGDDAAGAAEGKSQTVTFTGNAVKAISVHWKAGTSPTPAGDEIVLQDTSAAATRLQARVSDAGDGSPSVVMSFGTYLGYEVLADGVYRLLFQTAAVTAANTNSLRLYAGRTGTVADTGNVYWGGVQAENALTPSSYNRTTTGTSTRAVETFYSEFLAAPQAMTGYLKFRALGTEQVANLGLMRIGSATASTGAGIEIYTQTANRLRLALSNGSATATATFGASGEIDYRDEVEVRWAVSAAGALTFEVAVAETSLETVTASAPSGGLPSAFSGQRIYLNSLGSTNQGLAAIDAVKIIAGSKSMAEMRAA